MFTRLLDNPRCADPAIDPELFFATDPGTIKAAKAVCARCPERRACAALALAHQEEHGVFGGQGEAERRPKIRQARARERQKAVA